MTSARIALSFLTRLPGGRHPDGPSELSGALSWFPPVGALVGLISGIVYFGLTNVVSNEIAAVGAIAVGAVVTGGFHEDGLADSADSFGGYDRERRLQIMVDSRIGTFGTLALVLATAAKIFALAETEPLNGALALVIAHSLARAGSLFPMVSGPVARTEGLAGSAGDVPTRAVMVAVGFLLAAGVVGPATAASAVGVVATAAIGLTVARRHLGGVTGDVLGAVCLLYTSPSPRDS